MDLSDVNLQSILTTKHLGAGDSRVIDAFLSTWQPPATPLPLVHAVQRVPQTQPSVVETIDQDQSTVTSTTVYLQPVTMH